MIEYSAASHPTAAIAPSPEPARHSSHRGVVTGAISRNVMVRPAMRTNQFTACNTSSVLAYRS